MHGIAKSCETNVETVESIIKEVVMTMGYLVSKGSSINMNMRFGLFTVRNGYVSFKQFYEGEGVGSYSARQTDKGNKLRSNTLDTESMKEFDKYSLVGSTHRKELSVRTPSLAGTVLNRSLADQAHSYVHFSNPNPQPGKRKYAGVREQGYSLNATGGTAVAKAGLSFIHTPAVATKFGKRIYMGNYRMSDKEVFDLHMQQIQMKQSLNYFDKDQKIREEQEFSRFVQD